MNILLQAQDISLRGTNSMKHRIMFTIRIIYLSNTGINLELLEYLSTCKDMSL